MVESRRKLDGFLNFCQLKRVLSPQDHGMKDCYIKWIGVKAGSKGKEPFRRPLRVTRGSLHFHPLSGTRLCLRVPSVHPSVHYPSVRGRLGMVPLFG